MGDRGNIFVVDDYKRDDPEHLTGVYLYSHWGGSELPRSLALALDRPEGRNRWDDGAYLTRIIFDTLSAGKQGGETGFGISARMTDNEHDILVVDPDNREVGVASPGNERKGLDGCSVRFSFADFITKVSGCSEQEDAWEALAKTS